MVKIKNKILKPLLKIYPEVQTDEQLVFYFVFFDSFVFPLHLSCLQVFLRPFAQFEVQVCLQVCLQFCLQVFFFEFLLVLYNFVDSKMNMSMFVTI